jgi:hypothetical protein
MLKKPKAKAEQCKKQDKHVLMQGKVKYYRQREPRNNVPTTTTTTTTSTLLLLSKAPL